MIEKVLTVGAYGFTADSFVKALRCAHVDLFLDIRARRGMRGSAYAFANASRLEAALGAAGIRYVAAKEVAPTEAVRDAQRSADEQAGIALGQAAAMGPALDPPFDMPAVFCMAQAAILSARTGQPESPATIRHMAGLKG